MKAKDLIRILKSVSPEQEVMFSLGRTFEYREACAKAELVNSSTLYYLTIDLVEIHEEKDEEDIWIDIVLKQENYPHDLLLDEVETFNKTFKKIVEQQQ